MKERKMQMGRETDIQRISDREGDSPIDTRSIVENNTPELPYILKKKKKL